MDGRCKIIQSFENEQDFESKKIKKRIYFSEKDYREVHQKGIYRKLKRKLIRLWRMKLSDNSVDIQHIVHMSDNFH